MYCTSNDESDPYRKPNPMMLEHLTETYVGDDFDYIKSVSLMIGDASGKEGQFSDSDKKTAENFGIDYMDVKDFVKEMLWPTGKFQQQHGRRYRKRRNRDEAKEN